MSPLVQQVQRGSNGHRCTSRTLALVTVCATDYPHRGHPGTTLLPLVRVWAEGQHLQASVGDWFDLHLALSTCSGDLRSPQWGSNRQVSKGVHVGAHAGPGDQPNGAVKPPERIKE